MTIKEAIRILDPESSKEALLPYAYDSHQRRKVVDEACRVAVDELRKRQWISIEDKLPEKGERVLITNGAFVCESFLANNDKWQRGGTDLFFMQPTHWQPMPEPPKEGEENA